MPNTMRIVFREDRALSIFLETKPHCHKYGLHVRIVDIADLCVIASAPFDI